MPLGMRYPLACGFMGLLQTDTKKRPLSGRFERENALSRIFVGYRAHGTKTRLRGAQNSQPRVPDEMGHMQPGGMLALVVVVQGKASPFLLDKSG